MYRLRWSLWKYWPTNALDHLLQCSGLLYQKHWLMSMFWRHAIKISWNHKFEWSVDFLVALFWLNHQGKLLKTVWWGNIINIPMHANIKYFALEHSSEIWQNIFIRKLDPIHHSNLNEHLFKGFYHRVIAAVLPTAPYLQKHTWRTNVYIEILKASVKFFFYLFGTVVIT